MRNSRQEINEIIAGGMGLEVEFWCNDDSGNPSDCAYDLAPSDKYYQDCLQKDPLTCRNRIRHEVPDFSTWEGFGMIMEWWDKVATEGGFQVNDRLAYLVNGMKAERWPERIALYIASHFAGETIELDEVEA